MPIFGLNKERLWPIVRNLPDGHAADDFSISIEHTMEGFTGCTGPKLLPTFDVRFAKGQRRTTVFVKRMEQGGGEAAHYLYLAPRLKFLLRFYGVITSSNGEETLFLEYLPRMGPTVAHESFDEFSLDERRQLLTLLAQFHATPLTPEYRSTLPPSRVMQRLSDFETVRETLQAIESYAERGGLGDELHDFCRDHNHELRSIPDYQRCLHERVAAIPQVLTNDEFGIGWNAQGEARCFDLHNTAIGPRFSDVCRVIGGHEQDLGGHYLQEFEVAGGSPATIKDVLDTSTFIEKAWAFDLKWPLEVALNGTPSWFADKDEARQFFRPTLRSKLFQLMQPD